MFSIDPRCLWASYFYVLRCFDDDDITHVSGEIDPVGDSEIVEMELMLADLESLEKRRPTLEKKAKSGDIDSKALLELVEQIISLLNYRLDIPI